jgi:hypothetical protein
MRRVLQLFVLPILLCASVLLACASSLLAQSAAKSAEEYLLGTWRLDLSRSKYMPGPPPKAETRTYTRERDGMKGVIRRHLADGREEVIEYRADYDADYPVYGTQAYDTVRLKKIDERTSEAVLSHAGQVYGVAQRVIAEDGQTMTIRFRRETTVASVNNTAVYRKEKR